MILIAKSIGDSASLAEPLRETVRRLGPDGNRADFRMAVGAIPISRVRRLKA